MEGSGLWLLGAGVAALVIGFTRMRTRKEGAGMSSVPGMTAGQQVVDVRSAGEFRRGHLEGSLNLPLGDLSRRLSELDPARPVVVCCASGARSSAASDMLRRAGFQDVHDAGPWTRLVRSA